MSEPDNGSMRGLVHSLFFPCRPAAILRFVIAIIVGITVYRVLWGRPLPHVGEEVLKLAPARTNSDSAAAVILPSNITRSGASTPHSLPTAIRPGRTSIADVSMRYTAISTHIPSFTSATYRPAGSQMPRFHNSDLPTIAETFPPGFAAHAIDKLDGCKEAKSMTCPIFPSGMSATYKSTVGGVKHV